MGRFPVPRGMPEVTQAHGAFGPRRVSCPASTTQSLLTTGRWCASSYFRFNRRVTFSVFPSPVGDNRSLRADPRGHNHHYNAVPQRPNLRACGQQASHPPRLEEGSVSIRARLGRGVRDHDPSLSAVTHSSSRRSPAKERTGFGEAILVHLVPKLNKRQYLLSM